METVRFGKVVATCGRPEVHLLWLAPEKDKALQKAIDADRVMMIHQEAVGTKQDFGEVGFQAAVRGQILIFPKTLAAYSGKRVVGVQYELLEPALSEDEKPAKPVNNTPPKVSKRVKNTSKAPPAPSPGRPNLVPFKMPDESVATEEPVPPADSSGEKIAGLRKEVRKAMEALEDGRHVAAYQILQRIAQD